MTQTRRDSNSTEFGLWIREQSEVASENGFIATNIDFVWTNYTTGKWMLIEEKRHGYMPKRYQVSIFKTLDKVAQTDEHYCGFHLLVFTNTSPDDGRIYLDGKYISQIELIEFLEFSMPIESYASWFPDPRIIRINCTP